MAEQANNDGRARHPAVLVLQGGGALGAYQAGVYQALHEDGHEPDWVAGISIGAINAAIIAGNPRERRIERLRAFWDKVSSELTFPLAHDEGRPRRWFNEISAMAVAAWGTPGFFRPRMPPGMIVPGLFEPLSVYDTAPLHATLLELVDFDLLNDSPIRFSVGAVNVLTGNFTYFDNRANRTGRKYRIGPEHVMASGALPPGLPPVMIDGEPYWDGGLVSNTPLQYVLDIEPQSDMTVYQVDLFSARGPMPKTISEAMQREKDIRYSSRTRMNTELNRQIEAMRAAAARLMDKLPPELRDDPDAQALGSLPRPGAVCVMHLINRSEPYETQARDYEFSRVSVNGHWDAGIADAQQSLADPRWSHRHHHRRGIVTYDLTDPRGGRVRGDQG